MIRIWSEYSRKLDERLLHLRFAGKFAPEQAKERGMRLVRGQVGELCLEWLVDEADGVIADAKFSAIGPTILLAAADAASEWVLHKRYSLASMLSLERLARLIDAKPSFPLAPLQQVIDALDQAALACQNIPCPPRAKSPLLAGGWKDLPPGEQRMIIEEVIEEEIRPFIMQDGGGIEVIDWKENVLKIAYGGACAHCMASTGSTLQAIQGILRDRIHPDLIVTPETGYDKNLAKA